MVLGRIAQDPRSTEKPRRALRLGGLVVAPWHLQAAAEQGQGWRAGPGVDWTQALLTPHPSARILGGAVSAPGDGVDLVGTTRPGTSVPRAEQKVVTKHEGSLCFVPGWCRPRQGLCP